MNETQAISALGALAHTQRLRVFRALVVAGPEGLTPSVLADQLDVARNSLSFHLKELAHAGLVTIEQQGRNLIYRADFTQMNGLRGGAGNLHTAISDSAAPMGEDRARYAGAEDEQKTAPEPFSGV